MDELWYVAQLKAGGARIAEANLQRQGFEVFSPKIVRTEHRKGRLRDELRLLFPGYLFVRSAARSDSWRAIGGTLGIQRLVTFGQSRPSPLPAAVVAWLKEHCGNWSNRQSMFRKGDIVRVVSGPLSDLIARVDKVPSCDRIYVLLEFMGRERRISMSTDQLLRQPD
jgi:transcriptional antiterminator RfaH